MENKENEKVKNAYDSLCLFTLLYEINDAINENLKNVINEN